MRDLELLIDPADGRRSGLEDAIRRAVLCGQLARGERLPSTRALAAELCLARSTVVAAYEQLVAEGYLESRHGSGTRVADVAISAPAVSTTAERHPPNHVDFRPGEPDRSAFPRSAWATSVRSVLSTSADDLFGYPRPEGFLPLRSALASYLGRSRAVTAGPSNIVIFGGFPAALSTLAMTFERLGMSSIAVEDPGLPPHRHSLVAGGLAVVPTTVDDHGINVTELGDTDVGAALVTPAHQYPLGMPMASLRRSALVEWARSCDAWIIEDDYDGEFRYDRRPLGALQGLDPNHVIYAGTASKSLGAGLGLAWLVLPTDLVGPVIETKRTLGVVSNIEQAALADFIVRGRFDRHIRRMRAIYQRRRDALVSQLAQSAPWLTVGGISAGLHVTTYINDPGRTEAELVATATAKSIRLAGLAAHSEAPSTVEGIVIGYSRTPQHAYPAALDRLGDLLSGMSSRSRAGHL